MNSFLDGFIDGFTGAGMFFGPKPRQAVAILAEDSPTSGDQWIDSIQALLQTMANRANEQQRSEVTEEIRKLVHRVQLTPQTAVESGSRQ